MYANENYEGPEEIATMNVVKEQNFCHQSRKYLREYGESTGIHGVRYVTEKRSKTEKISWFIVLVISVVWCSYIVFFIIEKYDKTPILVTFAVKETPIYELPFPAVTFCPESKTNSDVFNFTAAYLKNMNKEEMSLSEKNQLTYASLLCKVTPEFEDDYSTKIDTADFYNKIDELKPPFDEMVSDCIFMGQNYSCRDLFVPIITDEGICYSFNMLNSNEIFKGEVLPFKNYYKAKKNSPQNWYLETGYLPTAGVYPYPRRALFSGADNALEIVMNHNKSNTDYLCKLAFQGYRVLLHNPLEMPRLSKHYFRVSPNQAVTVEVIPELTTTSEEVRNYSPKKRQCYFHNERPLKYFNNYSQENCMLECLSNFTLKTCGCVNFFMTRNSGVDICGLKNSICMKEAESKMTAVELQNKMSGSIEKNCDCKPLCVQLKYDEEVSQSEYKWQKTIGDLFTEDDIDIGSEDFSLSLLTIYFNSEQFLTLERNEQYGVSDLISNIGGLLGLFTGLSIISLVEIIYFLSLRLFCNIRMYKRCEGNSDL